MPFLRSAARRWSVADDLVRGIRATGVPMGGNVIAHVEAITREPYSEARLKETGRRDFRDALERVCRGTISAMLLPVVPVEEGRGWAYRVRTHPGTMYFAAPREGPWPRKDQLDVRHVAGVAWANAPDLPAAAQYTHAALAREAYDLGVAGVLWGLRHRRTPLSLEYGVYPFSASTCPRAEVVAQVVAAYAGRCFARESIRVRESSSSAPRKVRPVEIAWTQASAYAAPGPGDLVGGPQLTTARSAYSAPPPEWRVLRASARTGPEAFADAPVVLTLHADACSEAMNEANGRRRP